MKIASKLTATEMVQNLETANQALRNYVCKLEEKLARYERILQRCPRFLAEKSNASSPPDIEWTEPYHDEIDDDIDNDDFGKEDDWDGLEESDFEDGLEDEEDDWDGLEESDFEDGWEDEEDDWDGLEESDFEDDWEDEDLDEDDLADDDLEADGLKNPPSDGAYSEAVLQAFPHVRTIHRLVARRR